MLIGRPLKPGEAAAAEEGSCQLMTPAAAAEEAVGWKLEAARGKGL
eukprot:CAMPEP_0185193494 /NCGR_PEP_ID=MMETSP1140-20130426/26307_1 /TAXON_ID=298111 /ORGANISM="Pavlova sp., Strain CCMP459" /LENGTH=45 /DNA_ID= /DNA_START= /DNA_END= /DNA_ORIENTATION=